MPQLFAEFGVPAGGPPPLLLGTDRRDEPYVAQAAEHPVQGARRAPCLLGPLSRSGFPQDLMPVHCRRLSIPSTRARAGEIEGTRSPNMGIPCRAATVRGVRCEARPGLTRRASCPAVTSIPSQMCWVNQPAVPMWGTSSAHAHRLPGGRLRLAQPRRIVRRRPARRPGRVHGRRSGPVERRRAGRRSYRSSMAGQAQLVSGRHRGPDDPATGAAGPILGLSTQAASDCSPRQISKPDKDALNSASPGVRTHTDPPVRARRNRPWDRSGCST